MYSQIVNQFAGGSRCQTMNSLYTFRYTFSERYFRYASNQAEVIRNVMKIKVFEEMVKEIC
jgi:hypothetical protein